MSKEWSCYINFKETYFHICSDTGECNGRSFHNQEEDWFSEIEKVINDTTYSDGQKIVLGNLRKPFSNKAVLLLAISNELAKFNRH